MAEGSPGKFAASLPPPPPKTRFSRPRLEAWNLHRQGFCCTFPVYVVQMGILGTCHRGGGGGRGFCSILRGASCFSAGWAGGGWPGLPPERLGRLDSSEERGIPGILLNCPEQQNPREEACLSQGSPSRLGFRPLQRSQGSCSRSGNFQLPCSNNAIKMT